VKTDPPTQPVALPADIEPIERLHIDLCESRIARESIERLLAEHDQLYFGPDGRGLLASRKDYLAVLGIFCRKAGLSEADINPRRSNKSRDYQSMLQAKLDEGRAAIRAQLGVVTEPRK
jgi:hypothetical protein